MERNMSDTFIPVTMVGSYPRPQWYNLAFRGGDLRQWLLHEPTSELYRDAVSAILGDQERAGLDYVTDGEMYEDLDRGGRGWPGYVFDRLPGTTMHSAAAPPGQAEVLGRFPILRDTPFLSPSVVGPITTESTLRYADLYALARSLTSKPVKASAPDAVSVASWLSSNTFYKGEALPGWTNGATRELVEDVLELYRLELGRLVEAGCTIWQSDMPQFHFLGMFGAPDALWHFAIESFNHMVEPAVDAMQIWIHCCWGRPWGQYQLGAPGDFRGMFPRVFDAHFHVLNLEISSAEELALLRQVPADRSVALGLINPRQLQVESPESIAELLRTALTYIPPERLYVTTQCGLGNTLPRTVAYYKLQTLVKGVTLVRNELLGEMSVPRMQ